jgi:hypothetical protein
MHHFTFRTLFVFCGPVCGLVFITVVVQAMVAHLHTGNTIRPFVCSYSILTGPVSKVHPRKKAQQQHCASQSFILSTTTLSRQVPKDVIAEAIAAPTSHAQRTKNLIGDGTPWILLFRRYRSYNDREWFVITRSCLFSEPCLASRFAVVLHAVSVSLPEGLNPVFFFSWCHRLS